MITLGSYRRKPFEVLAVQVTEENMYEVSEWCGGEILKAGSGASYIKVPVIRPSMIRQTRAFAGDWILFSGRGYKVYTIKAFEGSFERTPPGTVPVLTEVDVLNGV